jgi:hypothetical protein
VLWLVQYATGHQVPPGSRFVVLCCYLRRQAKRLQVVF